MKVLMITPRVDESHDILGFIPGWIRKLAEKVDKLFVITFQYNTKTPLPENVIVYGVNRLGEKWDRASKALRVIRLLGRLIYFNIIMLRIVSKVDVVFCHMHPEFTIRAAPYAKLFRVPVVTWYVHGHVSRSLKIAHFLSNKMVTASKESLRIKNDKIIITGHGIDTEGFKPAVNLERKNKKAILSVGRISPRKDYETIIKAADILVNEKGMKDLDFVIVGGVPIASQEEYYERLKKMVRELELEDYVKFVGSVPYGDVLGYYQQCDIFVSTSQTGSLDKAVLEAMACEKPVITSNIAYYLDIFDEEMQEKCYFRKDDYKALASKIEYFLNNEEIELRKKLRNIVVTNHSMIHLANSLVKVLNDVMQVSLAKTLIIETLRGKSFGRTLFNYELKLPKVNGKILDLGAGRARPSYYRFLGVKDKTEVVTVDISSEKSPDFIADLENPFPFKSNSFDYIFAFNILEHIYNFKDFLEESYTVLKNDGKIYGVVPFLANVHGDPHDYFRYTETALLKILKEARFKNINIKALGFGPFTAAYSQIESLLPKIIRLLAIFICIYIDKLLFRIGNNKWPLGYLFMCRKGEE